jgi:hypothetical protein
MAGDPVEMLAQRRFRGCFRHGERAPPQRAGTETGAKLTFLPLLGTENGFFRGMLRRKSLN